MFQAYGLYTHIRANRWRSALLLASFVILLHALLFSVLLIINAFSEPGAFDEIVARAVNQFSGSWPVAAAVAGLWFLIAYTMHQTLIRNATGARGVSREQEPALYNALENLCISRGITMPNLQIIETPALNAYAAGVREGQYVIAVTRGLVDTLDDAELEAVLAHELTHIRNRDAQLMVIAVIFAGIFGFFGDMIIRRWDFPYGISPRRQRPGPYEVTYPTGSGSDNRDGRGRGAMLAVVVAIAIILISWGISVLIRFALSRSREYLADAGAVELTKNPDAMISALKKISANAAFDVPSRMEAFFIENPLKSRLSGLLATHPDIEDRIEALERFAGGRVMTGP